VILDVTTRSDFTSVPKNKAVSRFSIVDVEETTIISCSCTSAKITADKIIQGYKEKKAQVMKVKNILDWKNYIYLKNFLHSKLTTT